MWGGWPATDAEWQSSIVDAPEVELKKSQPWKSLGLGALGLVLALITFDIGRRLFASDAPVRSPRISRYAPPFKVGDEAPDFTLPDRTSKPYQLSSLVQRETLLCFTCGCANCIDLQSFTALLLKRLGKDAPEVVTVTTMPPDREETYFRDTGLKQKLLYEKKEGPVMKLFQGHPCPRVYRLAGDRTVTWIGSSPAESGELRVVGLELAAQLGFSAEEALSMQPGKRASQP